MSRLPLPSIPWQLTGNHWLAIPCVHPGDGAIHRLGVLHRGARAALEFTGAGTGDARDGAPLLRPVLSVDGQPARLGESGMAWERALGWLPTFTCTVGPLLVRGMLFCPFGRDADMAGAVYTLTIENRGTVPRAVSLGLAVEPGVLVPRVRSPRAPIGRLGATRHESLVVLDPGTVPGLAALAVGADGASVVALDGAGGASVTCERTLRPGEREEVAFYVAAGPEADGAVATSAAMRRRGWRWLLTATREAIETLQQATGSESLDRLLNRNLLFAYFYGVGRALDDAHFYLVRSRAPWHPAGVTLRDWDALMMTLPAVQLADTGLARELLLRMCELHGYAPGRGVHYLDGTMFEPAYSLDGVAAYAVALERYIRQTNDDHLIDDPVVGDTLYAVHDELADRRHAELPLYATEVAPSGEVPPHPYTLHGNAMAAFALEVLRRTLDEETAREVQDPEAVRAAIDRSFARADGGKKTYRTALDLSGGEASADDAVGSAAWLPLYEVVRGDDSTYRRTVRALGDAPVASLAAMLARLLGPDRTAVLEWLRRAPLDGGVAAQWVDADGRAVANGGDAALAGLVAATVLHVVGREGGATSEGDDAP